MLKLKNLEAKVLGKYAYLTEMHTETGAHLSGRLLKVLDITNQLTIETLYHIAAGSGETLTLM